MLPRATATYSDESEPFRFQHDQARHNSQYASLYFTRLATLKDAALHAARTQWGPHINNVKTLDAVENETSVVVGTIYAHLSGKPDVLKEVTRDVLSTRDTSHSDKYIGAKDDALLLEDDTGRIALEGEVLTTRLLTTGAIVAVRGVVNADGVLVADAITLPGVAPPRTPPAAAPTNDGSADKYVAFVSGLQLGRTPTLPLTLLAEYLTGQLGSADERKLQAAIVRLVVAGDSLAAPEKAGDIADAPPEITKQLSQAQQETFGANLTALDAFLAPVCASMPVDLMPGDNDPCSSLLPQQPMHSCLLAQASRFTTQSMVSNPYRFEADGVDFLGTSGQPIADMQRYLPGNDRLATLVETLELRHLAPTAPDTLGCQPFTTVDPFVLESSPAVYFAGNQPAFATKEHKGVRVVCVPDFSREHTLVLLNLRTRECTPVTFELALDGTAPMDE